jgi:hypothetical protein
VQSATATIPLLVYVSAPPEIVYAWDAQVGKTLDGSGKVPAWASYIGTATLDAAGFTSGFGAGGNPATWDATNVMVGNLAGVGQIGKASTVIAVPHADNGNGRRQPSLFFRQWL